MLSDDTNVFIHKVWRRPIPLTAPVLKPKPIEQKKSKKEESEDKGQLIKPVIE